MDRRESSKTLVDPEPKHISHPANTPLEEVF
jgi:hypothetical protein